MKYSTLLLCLSTACAAEALPDHDASSADQLRSACSRDRFEPNDVLGATTPELPRVGINRTAQHCSPNNGAIDVDFYRFRFDGGRYRFRLTTPDDTVVLRANSGNTRQQYVSADPTAPQQRTLIVEVDVPPDLAGQDGYIEIASLWPSGATYTLRAQRIGR